MLERYASDPGLTCVFVHSQDTPIPRLRSMQHPATDTPAEPRSRFPYFAAAAVAAFSLVLGVAAVMAGVPAMAVVLSMLAVGGVTTAALVR